MAKRTKELVEQATNTVELINGVYVFKDLNGVEYTFKKGDKSRYFGFVLYEDSAIENWRDKVADIIEWPWAYCTHDKDKIYTNDGFEVESERKTHTHFIIALPNGSTTYKAILEVVNRLGKVSYLKTLQNIKGNYDYLIHDTKKAREEHKHVYDKSERVESDDFDIGAYIQISEAEVIGIKKQLTLDIIAKQIFDYQDFILYVMTLDDEDDDTYYKIATGHQHYFESIIKGNYLKLERRFKADQQKNYFEKIEKDTE